MESFTVITNLGPEDWKALLRACGERARENLAKGPWYHRWMPFIVWVAMVALVVWLLQLKSRLFNLESLLISTVFVFGIVYAMAWRQRRAFRPMESGAFLGTTTFQFTPEHFVVTRAYSTARDQWALLCDITRTPTHVFLWIDAASTYCFRVADLPPSLSANEAVRRIQTFRAAGAVAPSAIVSAPAVEAGWPAPTATEPPEVAPDPIATKPSVIQELRALLRMEIHRAPDPAHLWGRDLTLALLSILALGVWAGIDRLQYSSDARIFWYGISSISLLAVGALSLAWLLSRLSSPRVPLRRSLLLVLACAPIVAVADWLVPSGGPVGLWFLLVLFVAWVTSLLHTGMRTISGKFQARAVFATVVVCLAMIAVGRNYYMAPDIWYEPDSDEEASAEDDAAMEQLLFEQASRIDANIARMPSGEAGRPSTWFVGFAGYGEQRVFAEEIGTASRAVGAKFSSLNRSLLLVNDRRDEQKFPLATVSALRHTLLSLGARMNKQDDVLFLALSSHGSEDATISVNNESTMYWRDLGAKELRAMLDESGIRWRVIVISACYSGSFIDSLRDDHTIVITAAAADRTSFGCSDDRDITEFGDAFYRQALPKAPNLRAAFDAALLDIAQRERAEGREASNPQAWFGPLMEAKLKDLEAAPVPPPATAVR